MTSPPSYHLLQEKMTQAALGAGKILMRHFQKRSLRIREKPGAGLVTNADLAAEEYAISYLKKAFPDFAILSEESSPSPTSSQVRSSGRWIIDPLDGTTNYAHGFPMFCVSIGLEWEGEPFASVIYHPALKDLYTAVKGRGAYCNRKRIHVSTTQKLRDSLLTTGFTYRKDEWLSAEMKAFERLAAVAQAIRRPGSAALDLAYTARGVFDGFWERRLAPWDIAAGILLVREAGGIVTDFHGRPCGIHSPEILASNPKLHRDLLAQIRAI